MKAITHCPYCNKELAGKSSIRQRWCDNENRIDDDHHFWCSLSFDKKCTIEIDMGNKGEMINWDFEEQSLWISRYTNDEMKLPFFDFDADDMPKTLNKLKTYMVFA